MEDLKLNESDLLLFCLNDGSVGIHEITQKGTYTSYIEASDIPAIIAWLEKVQEEAK